MLTKTVFYSKNKILLLRLSALSDCLMFPQFLQTVLWKRRISGSKLHFLESVCIFILKNFHFDCIPSTTLFTSSSLFYHAFSSCFSRRQKDWSSQQPDAGFVYIFFHFFIQLYIPIHFYVASCFSNLRFNFCCTVRNIKLWNFFICLWLLSQDAIATSIFLQQFFWKN